MLGGEGGLSAKPCNPNVRRRLDVYTYIISACLLLAYFVLVQFILSHNSIELAEINPYFFSAEHIDSEMHACMHAELKLV